MENLRGCVVDGRLENVRYRQNQLHQLHATLRTNSDRICGALSQGSAQANTEFYLALDSVKSAYDGLDFDNSLKEEYFVTKGKDNLSRRAGLGVVVIRPEEHSRLYSILTPLAVAIASKNAVLLEIGSSSIEVDKILADILPSALDKDVFSITSKLTESDISLADLFLDSQSNISSSSSRPWTSGRSIAIVDRSADLQLAAKVIVDSKLPPNGFSPYSPDLVLLNEFSEGDFITECLKYAETRVVGKLERLSADGDKTFQEAVSKAEKAKEVNITRSDTSGLIIVKIMDRSSKLISLKAKGPYLLLLPTTSVVDMLQSQESQREHLATYIFAPAGTAKFLAERVASAVAYINQIPSQLLIGPISSPHSLHPRFTTEMFSLPRPQIISAAPKLPSTVAELEEKSKKPLKPTGQRPGHAVGFFEQGIFIGLGVTVCFIIPATGWLLWTTAKRSWAMFR